MSDSYDWHDTNIEASSLADRSIKGIKIRDERLILCRIGDEVYALDGICPHAGAGLAGGWCSTQHDRVVCPLHRYEFDLETGKECTGKAYGIQSHPTKIEKGKVYIGFKRKRWIFW